MLTNYRLIEKSTRFSISDENFDVKTSLVEFYNSIAYLLGVILTFRRSSANLELTKGKIALKWVVFSLQSWYKDIFYSEITKE